MYEYHCKLERIVDGDTVDVTVDLGFKISQKMRIRLLGINTPEKGKPGYYDAIAFVQDWFELGWVHIVQTEKDKSDSFGRYLGRFYRDHVYGQSLNDELLNRDLAQEYTR